MKLTFTIIALALLIILIFAVTGSFSVEQDENEDTISFEEYRNTTYGFSLTHPKDWSVFGGRMLSGEPAINIYRVHKNVTPPLTHHSVATQVSVFPHGVPTEGVFGEQRPLRGIDLKPRVREARMYVLDDGTPWALFVTFLDIPETWNEGGFLWAEAGIDNLTIVCERNGEEIAQEECDPLFGDVVVRSGDVDEEEWNTIVDIVESFLLTNTMSADDNRGVNASDGCIRTGCSAQICSDEEVITTCEFQPSYACFESAICERQESGECGWTHTEAYRACILESDFKLRE